MKYIGGDLVCKETMLDYELHVPIDFDEEASDSEAY